MLVAFDLFQKSKTKIIVAPCWIKLNILKRFAENFSYTVF